MFLFGFLVDYAWLMEDYSIAEAMLTDNLKPSTINQKPKTRQLISLLFPKYHDGVVLLIEEESIEVFCLDG